MTQCPAQHPATRGVTSVTIVVMASMSAECDELVAIAR